ncbi:hypothetical protein Bpfe_015789 [Biomphalaria pfeifferi]|uniref:Uncharacterized protein n=1 Tax=Biomphalaria pfeifferi TaxID=112525 RepID=A0AAD8F7N6_BIOPF|nr:hypothetical protein Bpfe_015789 [Biomphalaria pfeifferi]
MLEGVLNMCLCLVLIVSGWPPGQAKPYIKDLRWSAGQSETSIKENTTDDDTKTLLNTRHKNLKGKSNQ